jgi:hypothetical protein
MGSPRAERAADLIEAQAARIQQQALEYTSLFDQCSEALERVKVLEAENKRDRLEFRADCERQSEEEVKLRKRIADLEAQIVAAKEQKPIYQVWNERTGFYADVTAEYYAERLPSNRRKVYAHPPIDTASEDKRDAERYRWLLGRSWGKPAGRSGAFEWRMPGFTCCAKEPRQAFDVRIDAAIAAEKKEAGR